MSDLVDSGVVRRLRVWGVDGVDDIARLERLGVSGVVIDSLGLIGRWQLPPRRDSRESVPRVSVTRRSDQPVMSCWS